MKSVTREQAVRIVVVLLLSVNLIGTALGQRVDAASQHLERGIELAHQGKFPDAASAFVQALALNPKLAEAHYLLGLVRQNWGKLEEAEASYRAALRLNARYAEAQLGLAAVLTRKAHDQTSWDGAIAACRRAIELNPKDAEPHFHLASIEAQKRNLKEAVAGFEMALRLQADYPGARLALASALLDLREFDRAIPMLRSIAAAEPDNALVHHQLGTALAKQGDAAGAVEELKSAVRLDAMNPQTHYVLATSLRKLGRSEEASQEMRRFQELSAGRENGMQARYHAGLAQKLVSGGKLEEAIAEYQQSLSYRQDTTVATDLAVILLSANRVDEAVEILREAVRSSPEYLLAHYHLGLAYARKSDYANARRAFTAALKLRPEFPEALFNLGMTFAMEGRLEDAEKLLRDSIRLRPDQAPSRYYLGVVLRERGNLSEAEAQFEAARRLDPNFRPEPAGKRP